uniref:Death domain-containing protein n=1 Tax=Biomphalaria glabrata TaxID=6526 RepID=A0A2C9LA31_BIOGL
MTSKKSAPKGKRSPSGKKGKKEEIEDPIITFLKKTTEDLREENATLKASLSTYQEKLQVITQQIIDVNFDNYKAPQDIALVDIPLADILTIITNLTITPGNKLHSYELQIEELETRVTQLNSELAKLIKLKLKLENGLKDMDRMYTVEDLKVQAKRLWYDCCNDWRLMAARVGLPEDLVQHWLAMRAPNAMALVMKVWGDSAGATVRMLHRHLSSPQMREVILAKMLSDFYDVE